ncbi:cytochrome P450 2J4-like isoform X2 [Triplophysa dalaica]|uniref:cytochrome P450 2J4-like isoform X2 n=1 Tax=Triplophysa dalaica TaxID=1582913 RepID=UPI0024DF6085|nr:cytochrome P450 2J4-like isoform X2 [Triplophysa dalaica]
MTFSFTLFDRRYVHTKQMTSVLQTMSQLIGEWLDVQGILIFLCVLLFVKHLRDVYLRNLPPGPFPLPFIGNLLDVGFKDPLGSFQRISEQYGDVCTVFFGSKPFIMLTGYKNFKEAFVERADIFTDRPSFPISERLSEGKGLFMTSGHMWRQQRRFALSTLKYFGVGKKTLENAILQECRFLSDTIRTERGLPYNPHRVLVSSVSNIICGLMFGHRFEYDDHNFHLMQKYIDDILQLPISTWGRLYDQFPTLMSLLPGKHQTAFASMSKLKPFIQEEIRKHKEDRDPFNPRDYIDCYLDEIEVCNDREAEFTEENLIYCAVDLFAAGTETTSNTLNWGLLFIVKNPKVQEKVQSEIDQVIGQTRQPVMDDRIHLPYTYAVIHEIQRVANIITITPPRVANKDIRVAGHLIPKGVVVFPLLKPILEDKNEYSTPLEFNPAHFLDENGKFLKKENFIPFSIGKRMCPGEQLARMELFLFFTSLMQNFTFLPVEGQTLNVKRTISVSVAPEPFNIRAIPR